MKIACIMVTEKRAPIWGIGLTSFLTQWHADKRLFVILPADQEVAYRAAAKEFEQHPCWSRVTFVGVASGLTVQERKEIGCQVAFSDGFDLVATFDDDDWAPPDRLVKTVSMMLSKTIPSYGSYARGWFVNLRTLYGEFIETFPYHLWGGCLTFNESGFHQANGFLDKPFPGIDRAFMRDIKKCGEFKEYILPSSTGAEYPVAFSHGKNVSTWLKMKGTQMEGVLKMWMPSVVLKEVMRCQKLMVDTRTFPPQPDL